MYEGGRRNEVTGMTEWEINTSRQRKQKGEDNGGKGERMEVK